MSEFSVRNDIERAIKELKINSDEFHEVSKLQWNEVLLKIEEHFVDKKYYTHGLHWAWLRLKEPIVSFRLRNDDGFKYISDIVNEEYVWFIAEDSKEKMWIYEGKPYITSKIISESYYIDEYYIVSKKYKWLLCENHESIICGSGEKIVNQINKFKAKSPELIFM